MAPVDEDPRWAQFDFMHRYLLEAFPLLYGFVFYRYFWIMLSKSCFVSLSLDHRHTSLDLTKVNTYGLVYRWEGSDSTLKPLLLAAHQGKLTIYDSTGGEYRC